MKTMGVIQDAAVSLNRDCRAHVGIQIYNTLLSTVTAPPAVEVLLSVSIFVTFNFRSRGFLEHKQKRRSKFVNTKWLEKFEDDNKLKAEYYVRLNKERRIRYGLPIL